MTGTVLEWFALPGYGRILADAGERFFVHRTALQGTRDLSVGSRVDFIAYRGPRGPRAEGCRVIAPAPLVQATEASGAPACWARS